MVAADIKSRYVVYGGADEDPSDLLCAPIFRAARVGVMAWVRRRLSWRPARCEERCNAGLCARLSRGSVAPDGHANILALRRQARVVHGMRTGAFPGGPQHEGVFLKAAGSGTAFCAMACGEGCRACVRRGQTVVPKETNMHCFLRCWSNSRADLVTWCRAVLRQLGDLEVATRRLHGRADDIREVVREAADCIRQPTSEGWLAVRRVVGGALPPWGAPVTPSLEREVAGHVEGLQVLFTQRLEEWARYMAAYGVARQGKWNQRGWMRLIFEAMRTNAGGARGRRCGGAGTQGPHCCEGGDASVPHCEGGTVEAWFEEERDLGTRVASATRALVAYTRWVARPAARAEERVRRAREDCMRRRRGARYRIARLLWGVVRKERAEVAAANRVASRGDRPAYRTRSLGADVPPANLDETRRRGPNKVRAGVDYCLMRWPRRDKLGWTVVRLLRDSLGILPLV